MLTVLSGAPHPALDEELRRRIERFSGLRGFSAMAIVVPSAELLRDLRLRIAREWGLACLGLHLCTAHGFALRVLGREPAGTRLADGALLDYCLRRVIARGKFPRLAAVAETAGGGRSLAATLRDLEEADVPPDATPPRGAEEIFRLYREFEKTRAAAGLLVPADVMRRAAAGTGESDFIRGLTDVLCFGFYDMTGTLVGLLRAVSAVKPVTVFLPGEGAHPAFAFAEAFRREALGDSPVEAAPAGKPALPALAPLLARLFRPGEPGAAAVPGLKFISVSGMEGEIEAAAREALRLAEDDEIPFREIAVVARSLEPYREDLSRVFAEFDVPFRTPAARPGGADPLGKAVLALVRALAGGLGREDVLMVFRSPWFAGGRWGLTPAGAADLVREARERGIAEGAADWERLRTHLAREGGNGRAAAAALGEMIAVARRAPAEGTWADYAAAFERIIGEFLTVPDDAREAEKQRFGEFRQAIADLARFSAAGDRATRAEFLAASAEAVDAVGAEPGEADADAVEILDAMSLRFRAFRAVIVLGLHEGSFPRMVRPDPFLRDEDRREIARRTKTRLPPKSAGFDEEKLLFHLALSAARERAALIRQRSDDEGKPLVPSWYYEECRHLAGRPGETLIPRRFTDRITDAPGRAEIPRRLLSAREWREGRILFGDRDPGRLRLLGGEGFVRAVGAAAEIVRIPEPRGGTGDALGPRDGIILRDGGFPGPEGGFSPTALQDYARCPFAYFMKHRLRVRPGEENDRGEVDPLAAGQWMHRVLERVFRVVKDDFTAGRTPDPGPLLDRAAGEVFRKIEKEEGIPAWPLLWERVKREIRDILGEYLAGEIPFMAREKWVPGEFEYNGAAALPDNPVFPASVRGRPVKGRVDRLDVRKKDDGLSDIRVVDYKFKSGSGKPYGLEAESLKGRVLQPAVYILLARAWARESNIHPAAVSAGLQYLAPNHEPRVFSESLPPEWWEGPNAAGQAGTLGVILDGIARGRFFVRPGACDYCEFPAVCRKSLGAVKYRLLADSRPRALQGIAGAKPVSAEKSAGDGKTRKTRGRKS
ncbi:MAG: PD-(D/E)XK nuclease family protein [Planctomycetota bacterium]